ncbi:MAG: hypothetical protein JXA10_03250, partial [Anaerolineae bacterium]|nr:hypothetical protein [Anaerolineae bacterium]
MEWHEVQAQILAFLQDEQQILQRKSTRQHNGFHASNSHQNGSNGYCTVEWNLEILETIIAAQQKPDALSLESTIICKAGILQRQIANLRWQRGQPSPPDYWRLECQRAYLG